MTEVCPFRLVEEGVEHAVALEAPRGEELSLRQKCDKNGIKITPILSYSMQVRALDKGKYSTDYCTKEAHISVVNIQQQAVYPGGTCESLVKPDMMEGGVSQV